MTDNLNVGVVGGTGQLGSAIATAWLSSGEVAPQDLWISNRSGTAAGFEAWPSVNVTASNQDLADHCDVILLSVPPALAGTIGVSAPGKLVISVMAGICLQTLGDLTGSRKTVRAMSSPAARWRLAYSPWVAVPGLEPRDRTIVEMLFATCGSTDEVSDEHQIEVFTAITGPVPGFAAYFADCMVQYAVAGGVDPKIASKAVKQLLLASGEVMSDSQLPPAAYVQEMIDYGGTTAAGLLKLQDLGVDRLIAEGLDSCVERVRTIAGAD
ncbi:pyrroline-5-carboxylate reductase family protein [Roseibium sp.]|uniref:pyrroline-5-carboxylate reductase family protein n=1 Tax=Roseibium sp. TaxID=1936156 RepID=UPI003D0F47A9